MSDTPFIKFFPSDFLGGTSGLSPAERGVYITLLCLIWDGGGPITMDEGRLARRCGMPKAPFKRALEALIDEGKIIRTAEGLTNDRAKKTLIDRQNRTQNATHAARSRWSEEAEKIPKKQGAIDAGAMPGQCVADAKPEARVQIEEESKASSSKTRPAREEIDRYLEYAKAHPKHVESPDAERLFSDLIQAGEDPKTIIAAAQAYAAEVKGWSPEARVQRSDNFLDPHRGQWRKYIPAKPAPKPNTGSILDFWADRIRQGKAYGLSDSVARQCVDAGLVSEADLKTAITAGAGQ